MKIYTTNNLKQCSVCKKNFSMSFYDIKNYVYKIKTGKKYIYQCSYACYRKEKIKYDIERNTIKE